MAVHERKSRVLIIEEDVADARRVADAIAESGRAFEVERVDRLQDGLDRLGRDRFDVVVLNLELPDSCEMNTLDAVSCRHPDVPVVVLAGPGDDTLGVRAVQSGAQDFLSTDHILGRHVAAKLRFAIERHRVRRALERNITRVRASELKFRNVFESAGDGLVVVEPNGSILSANASAALLLSARGEDPIGTIFPAELRPGECRVHAVGGRSVETNVTRTVWGGRSVYLASMRDVTERAHDETGRRVDRDVDPAPPERAAG